MSLDDDELCNIPRVSWDVLYMEIVRYVYNGQYINNNKILNDKLSSMGSYVGFNLLKLLIRNRSTPGTDLQRIKFICKDFWSTIFGKTIDRQQTDNKDLYILRDSGLNIINSIFNSYYPINNQNNNQFSKLEDIANKYLQFIMGILHGAVQAYGLSCTVSSSFEIAQDITRPIEISLDMMRTVMCVFSIRVINKNPST